MKTERAERWDGGVGEELYYNVSRIWEIGPDFCEPVHTNILFPLFPTQLVSLMTDGSTGTPQRSQFSSPIPSRTNRCHVKSTEFPRGRGWSSNSLKITQVITYKAYSRSSIQLLFMPEIKFATYRPTSVQFQTGAASLLIWSFCKSARGKPREGKR